MRIFANPEADLETLLRENFFDPDSEDEFEGFTQADIDSEVVARVDEDSDSVSSDSDSESESENDSSIPSGYQHQWHTDFSETSGPKEIPDGISEGQLFRLFMTDEIINKLVTEMNRYASQKKEKRGRNVGPHSYISSWKDISFDEMKAFLAILLLTGLTKRPSFDLYGSTDDFIEMPSFRNIMSRDRFMAILSFFSHLRQHYCQTPRTS